MWPKGCIHIAPTSPRHLVTMLVGWRRMDDSVIQSDSCRYKGELAALSLHCLVIAWRLLHLGSFKFILSLSSACRLLHWVIQYLTLESMLKTDLQFPQRVLKVICWTLLLPLLVLTKACEDLHCYVSPPQPKRYIFNAMAGSNHSKQKCGRHRHESTSSSN